jgi:hypothetical protein
MSAPPAGSELEATIEAALSELEMSVAETKYHSDPLRFPLLALAAFLRAIRVLYADSIMSMRQQIEAAKQPVNDDQLRRAVIQGISGHAGATVRALEWRNVVIGAGLLAGALLVGAAGGYWYGVSSARVASVSGCAPAQQAGGGEAWACTFSLHPAGATSR